MLLDRMRIIHPHTKKSRYLVDEHNQVSALIPEKEELEEEKQPEPENPTQE